MSLSLRNLTNSGWSLFNILLYPVAFMGLTPVFIHRMGEAGFGVWMLVNSYVYIAVNIISFGFSNSITAHVAEALGKENREKLHAYLHASSRIILILTLSTAGIALAGLLLIHLFPAWFSFPVHPDLPSEKDREGLGLVLVVATLLIAVKFPELLFQSIFKGFERFDRAGQYNILSKFLVLGAQLGAVLTGQGLLVMFSAALAVNMAVNLLQWRAVGILIPDYVFAWKRHLPENRELFIFGFWTWIQTIVSVAAYQADRFLVAFVLGPITAGYYILASTIANHMHMAFGALAVWLFPKVARRQQTAPDETLDWFHTLRGFTTGLSLTVILLSALLYEPFFRIWIGPDKLVKLGPFFALFLMYEALLILSIIPQFYLNGIRKLRFITFLELMYKAGILAGMIIAFRIRPTGESLLIGQVIALAVLMPVEYYLVNRRVLHGPPFGETVIAMVPSFCVAAIIWLDSLTMGVVLATLAAGSFIVYYLRPSRFNLKLLFS